MTDVLRPGPENWYRNETWSVRIELAFLAKLGRTRGQGPQYLTIQISHLAETCPEDALRLAELYFDVWSEPFWDGPVWTSMGRAEAARGHVDAATEHFLAALEWQKTHPTHDIGAAIRFGYWVASHAREPHYPRALQALEELDMPVSIFPLDRFRAHAALALLQQSQGRTEQARSSAHRALEDASLKQSGVPGHQTLGLVIKADAHLMAQLKTLAGPAGAAHGH